jgi:hypothetical protein
MISFDNFPESSQANFRLTPRSQEALKRTGFKGEDLVVRTADDINSKYGDTVTDKHLIEKRVQHYEEKRRAKIDILRKTRAEVVEEEGKGLWNANSVTRPQI